MASQSNDDSSGNQAARRDIHEIRRYVKDVRAQYYERLNGGGIDRETHQDLRTALLRYWDALHEFRDDIEKFWNEKNLDKIPYLAKQTTTVEVSTPGYGGGKHTRERPKLATVDAEKLVEWTHALDKAARELGFAAEPDNESLPFARNFDQSQEEEEEEGPDLENVEYSGSPDI